MNWEMAGENNFMSYNEKNDLKKVNNMAFEICLQGGIVILEDLFLITKHSMYVTNMKICKV